MVVPGDRSRVKQGQGSDGPEAKPPRVMVADDDRTSRDAVANCLRGGGYIVEAVDSGQDVLDRLAQGGVDLVLLDVLMPRLSGLETCKLIKAMGTETFVPVILVTAKTDTASRVEGLKIGADDYICKPVEELELLARVSAMMRIKRMYDDVAFQRSRLRKLSVYDDLTGVYNQRYASARLSEEFKRSERYHEPFACMLVDVDPIRALGSGGGWVNDDALMKTVAERLRKGVREVDIVARHGPDSFLVVLPSTNFVGAITVSERIWREVSDQAIDVEGVLRKVTVSIGIALYPSMDIRSKESLIKSAEEALVQAKRSGGGKICAFQQQGYIYTPPAFGSGGGAGPPSSRRGAELAGGIVASGARGGQGGLPKRDPDAPVDSQRRKPT
jgi:two-component system, cell cycle response regulator